MAVAVSGEVDGDGAVPPPPITACGQVSKVAKSSTTQATLLPSRPLILARPTHSTLAPMNEGTETPPRFRQS